MRFVVKIFSRPCSLSAGRGMEGEKLEEIYRLEVPHRGHSVNKGTAFLVVEVHPEPDSRFRVIHLARSRNSGVSVGDKNHLAVRLEEKFALLARVAHHSPVPMEAVSYTPAL